MRFIGAAFTGLGILLFGFLAASAYRLSAYDEGRSAFIQDGRGGAFFYSGAIHCHTTYSDGSGSVDEVARAAREAGCDFVVVSDHNNLAARFAGEEGYRHGVLVLCDQEVSTPGGHLLVLGCPREIQAADFTNLQSLVDTVAATGGLAFAAHPFLHRRPWTDWSLAGLTGFELLNADAEWRNDGPLEILRTFLFLRTFPLAAFNGLTDRPEAELDLLDRSSLRPPYVTIGATDAHARVRLSGSRIVRFPTYETMFRLVRTIIVTDSPFSGRPDRDRELIYAALRRGRCYAAFAGLGDARGLEFHAGAGDRRVGMGETIGSDGGAVTIAVDLPAAEPTEIELRRDGRVIAAADGSSLSATVGRPGLYRVEVYKRRRGLFGLLSFRLPWAFSNPIVIDSGPAARDAGVGLKDGPI